MRIFVYCNSKKYMQNIKRNKKKKKRNKKEDNSIEYIINDNSYKLIN